MSVLGLNINILSLMRVSQASTKTTSGIEPPNFLAESTSSTAIDLRESVYPLGENHPLAHLFGKYNDNPVWEEFEEVIRENPNILDYDIE
jgi:hypothetical protein